MRRGHQGAGISGCQERGLTPAATFDSVLKKSHQYMSYISEKTEVT